MALSALAAASEGQRMSLLRHYVPWASLFPTAAKSAAGFSSPNPKAHSAHLYRRRFFVPGR